MKPFSFHIRSVYGLYERRLNRQVRCEPMPRHIGLILDGNRRHGLRQNLARPSDVYVLGANKLDELLEWCSELSIPAVTLWVFSTENLKRKPDEISGILTAIETKLRSLAAQPKIHERKIRVRAVGRLDLLPSATVCALREAETATAEYDGLQLTIAAAYGGRQEIVDAVQSLLGNLAAQGKTLQDAIALVTSEFDRPASLCT